MLLVSASIRPSKIHGLGCFTNEPIKKGDVTWVFDPRIDIRLPVEDLPDLPPAIQEYYKTYGYTEVVHGDIMLTMAGDHSKHMNHAENPNIITGGEHNELDIAARDIEVGEELTCNYHTFDLDAEHKVG